jgi:hypothetical protein
MDVDRGSRHHVHTLMKQVMAALAGATGPRRQPWNATFGSFTTGMEPCANGRILCWRPKVGAVGVDRHLGHAQPRPSGQDGRWRSPASPDGMPSGQTWSSGQAAPWSNRCALLSMQDLTQHHAVGLGIFFFSDCLFNFVKNKRKW